MGESSSDGWVPWSCTCSRLAGNLWGHWEERKNLLLLLLLSPAKPSSLCNLAGAGQEQLWSSICPWVNQGQLQQQAGEGC